jgi:hypothetical protein
MGQVAKVGLVATGMGGQGARAQYRLLLLHSSLTNSNEQSP